MKCFQQKLFTGIVLLFIIGIGCQTFAEPITITGVGASFPFPVYSQWAHTYYALTEMKLDYQSIGSGGGIAQIKAKTVDFGASDVPLQPAELDEFGLIQFPMVMGGVVAVVNIQGIKPGDLRLNHNVLADIFLGKITTWKDPNIVALNPGLTLPEQEITVLHRADGSGTTWIFTNYLDKVSAEWHEKVGTANTVKWPVGVAGKGNEGISQYVKKINGAIGYVEFAYALQNNMAYVLLENQAGKFVAPTIETFQAAASNADWGHAPGFYMVLTDQPGDESWPITGASFILLYKEQKDLTKARTLLKFFDWCYHDGTELAKKLHYVPMPENVVTQVQTLWKNTVHVNGKPVWK
ncbi:phosphate-binding periplasmic protein [Candidatus Vecturithrix granuli]|uniref:Phosphate-binding protein n=1 Tax=Vecturithrix granuli TaxID=1499967 RepID=A0A0S6WA77_VECG1|nr:phosphate-binding periplasmic protein [Candidatus Vecturithrix granuli]